MLSITKSLAEEAGFRKLVSSIEAGKCPAVISGLSEIHRAHVAAAIRAETMRPVAVICAGEDEAGRLARDIAALTMEQAHTVTSREFTFHDAEVVSRQTEQKRIATLSAMSEQRAPIVVMSISGALQRTLSPDKLKGVSLTVKAGTTYSLTELADRLTLCGYSRSEQVEGHGQFAVRGGILDFFSPAHEEPVRCEFFGDEIDAIGFFDISTQRRTEPLGEAQIAPVAEALPSLYSGAFGEGALGLAKELEDYHARLEQRSSTSPELLKNLTADIDRLLEERNFTTSDRYIELISPMSTPLDYLQEESIVIICEPLRVQERAEGYLKMLATDSITLLESGVLESSLVRFSEDWEGLLIRLESFPIVMTDSFASSTYPLTPKTMLSMDAKRLPSYGGSLETASSEVAHYIKSGFRTVILCQDKRRADRLREYLEEREITSSLDSSLQTLPDYGQCVISIGELSAGLEYPSISLAIVTEGQMIVQPQIRRVKKTTRQKTTREKLQSFSDLAQGDLVVHDIHGIGRFVGFFKLRVDDLDKDYIKIAYAGTDSLYVPTTQLDMVAKYIGGGEEAVGAKLSKLGGTEWIKAKTRAKKAAKEMARELIKLYAERQRIEGRAFAKDTVWQAEFEDKFGYQETDDQLKSTKEIKEDMEKSIPMDRLLCGDVGYGKTEVALRAVMKCILSGYQAAILVPTTVLAQQHFVTSMRRFAGYPVNIEVLSRFRTPAQMRTALRDIKNGSVDFIIGTHRLLQKDIEFNKLGLLVVDEEQRFGVSHKEKLKSISKKVDVLTLSATPIPRTLNMALSGIRDMSTIEEPPQSRRPVQTYVMEHDYGILCDAIRRELDRGGQVYYLHNRIETIDREAGRLSEMLDGVRIGVAHGRMDEDHLSEVMEQMIDGDIQVLVCTTIIESGIDIPNVNTLIVEDADKLGLAQLHQIRGRVGRSPRRSYAYLTFRQGKSISEIAEKRLTAIREFAEFNSGFKIAMRDLEIRGAGSLLGSEQSGHMISVGYDMYLKLLEEAVLEEKGEKAPKKVECLADFNVSAGIPDKYVPSAKQRMDVYRRIALIRSQEDHDDMVEELNDRYGEPPPQVLTLISVAMLRAEASEIGIVEISQKEGWLSLKLSDFNMESISTLYALPDFAGRIKVLAGTDPAIALKLSGGEVVDEAVKLVRSFAYAISSLENISEAETAAMPILPSKKV
ncbi:MAG: transcription-repair coupling factor [Oscillospiraceae bacterium]|nr:transcription-repair coupling factor [Oscillospiraceae bacterium]MCL2279823.1 transcription-repair coupling factor [Oscillospiraceae bacterium]